MKSLLPFHLLSEYQSESSIVINLTERLPHHVVGNPELKIHFHIKPQQDYFILHYQLSGTITLTCQRCLNDWMYTLPNEEHLLALCIEDSKAEALMEQYETMTLSRQGLELIEVATDHLHLYLPWVHDTEPCRQGAEQ